LGFLNDIGYAMTKICAPNQNEEGYWATGPKSQWLYHDYGIEHGFYDTRFSTDFAKSLLTGYLLYDDKDFLERAEKYASFLMNFAETEGYHISPGAILVPDYKGVGQHTKTHVSLNHQLAELNFLFRLYMIAGDKSHYDMAWKLLSAVEYTENDWILEDNNLRYAILYDESVIEMRDYPFLTYNDLFETRELLMRLGEHCTAVNRLMASKKKWMGYNGVTGYRER
jgi:hypothetical protein